MERFAYLTACGTSRTALEFAERIACVTTKAPAVGAIKECKSPWAPSWKTPKWTCAPLWAMC